MEETDFSDQFRNEHNRFKSVGYDSNIMQQPACLAIYPITVNRFAALLNCTLVNRASNSMMAST